MDMKEIKKFPKRNVWDFDHRFKTLMSRFIFSMSDVQHKEWFIAALVSDIRQPLTQQKIATQSEALEIAMKLNASPMEESIVRVNQI